MNNVQKKYFIGLTHFLGNVLGPKYEVVFHSVDKNKTSMEAIANNHVSGRTLSSPLSSFALNMLQDKVYLDKDFVSNYKAVGDSDKLIRGSTYFIKNGDKLEGILCINHDTSELVDTMSKLISLENLGVFVNLLGIDSAFAEMEESEIISQEKLENSVEDILSEYIDLTLLDSEKSLTLRQKKNSIRVLFEKGIFNIKGAVPFVAKYLRISEPSVYRYLKNIKQKK
ncbi:PAS domain-containing protein [Pasteurella caecimuris]|uniref:helix-turn-helix transcriptional regulator n=1 Tax=Rodentibacter caecimuris TaxID=1796644 RepID=UPI00215006D3|nr:PAS domain-containing protein [Pasteurella caecimuris]MCR1836564.1 PAS domain-containing protein [Pasteurella caecimuris]MCU0106516.1 PAS domain-containing protein [Pasteurella caecimuris]